MAGHLLCRHRVLLRAHAESLQQLGSTFGVRRVIARWRIGGHPHQLLVKVGIDPGVELLIVVH